MGPLVPQTLWTGDQDRDAHLDRRRIRPREGRHDARMDVATIRARYSLANNGATVARVEGCTGSSKERHPGPCCGTPVSAVETVPPRASLPFRGRRDDRDLVTEAAACRRDQLGYLPRY